MPPRRSGLTRWLPLGALAVGVVGWLWPIGVGGRMPVGGDVTQFSIGLMAVLARLLRAWHLPLWNPLWGYGFPGVGESQMGVFYPPHWVLYGGLSLEAAYTASLVLHTAWGAAGAYWAARRFGASEAGSALAGLVWSSCGFFVIHLAHQWGYTTGSWMPWAWGLAWSALRGEGRRTDACRLSVVLAVQLLPGHFQLAFCTEVGVALLAATHAIERGVFRREGGGRALGVLAAAAGAFALAAVQVGPTLRLARLAAPRRDFEYLSGFAATPLHLVSFVAPGLFEQSPLWRPVVWDPLHTSPEEYLGYVGLVPLLLALVALGRCGSRPEVRALAVVAAVTLWLALGPYVPGFRVWCGLPGFSFFRAPARWTLAVSLALSLLAGPGYDALPGLRRPGRLLGLFALGAAVWVAGALLFVEGVVLGSFGEASARTGSGGLLDRLPWGETGVQAAVRQAAGRPNSDHRVQEAWARQGVRLAEAPRPVFLEQRFAVYRQELAVTAGLLAALGLVAVAARDRRWVRGALILLTVLDLGWLSRQRRVDLGPVAPLTAQSPILARMAREPEGTRTLDPVRNLPMVAGAAPVSAYRTLDLPALDSLTFLAGQIPGGPDARDVVAGARRLTGATLRVYDPSELVQPGAGQLLAREPAGETVEDPSLAGWRLGADWVAQQGAWARTFRVARLPDGGTLAWFVPLTPPAREAILGEWDGRPGWVLDAMRGAKPAVFRRTNPEHDTVSFHSDGPGLVVVSQLADPQWQGTLEGASGTRPVAVRRAFGRPGQGAWQAVEVPSGGDWTLRLNYRGDDVAWGFGVSLASWVVLAGVWSRLRRSDPAGKGGV